MKGIKERGRVPLNVCLLLIFLACAAGGCWSRLEIEQMAFVSVVGVDRGGPQGVLVSFQVVVPRVLALRQGGAAGQGPPVVVTSVEARNVSEALARFSEVTPRGVRFKQLHAIVLGEDLARQGVGPALDFFSRHWEVRRSTWVLVAKGRAQDVLVRGRPALERIPGTGIRFILERRPAYTSTRFPVVLGDFLTALNSLGREPVASSVEVYPMREAVSGGGSGGQGGAVAEGRGAEESKELAFKGAAVFRDDRLLDFLGPRETRGVLWVQGKVKGGIINVPAPARGSWASLVVSGATTRVKPEVKKDRIRFRVEIKEEGFV